MPVCGENKDVSQAPYALLPFATQAIATLLAKSNTENMPGKYDRLISNCSRNKSSSPCQQSANVMQTLQ
jgi:hypothetical protein